MKKKSSAAEKKRDLMSYGLISEAVARLRNECQRRRTQNFEMTKWKEKKTTKKELDERVKRHKFVERCVSTCTMSLRLDVWYVSNSAMKRILAKKIFDVSSPPSLSLRLLDQKVRAKARGTMDQWTFFRSLSRERRRQQVDTSRLNWW